MGPCLSHTFQNTTFTHTHTFHPIHSLSHTHNTHLSHTPHTKPTLFTPYTLSPKITLFTPVHSLSHTHPSPHALSHTLNTHLSHTTTCTPHTPHSRHLSPPALSVSPSPVSLNERPSQSLPRGLAPPEPLSRASPENKGSAQPAAPHTEGPLPLPSSRLPTLSLPQESKAPRLPACLPPGWGGCGAKGSAPGPAHLSVAA